MRVSPLGFGVRLSVLAVFLTVFVVVFFMGCLAPAVRGEDAVGALLARMTLEEKVGQMTQFSRGNATGPDNVKADQYELAAKGGVGSVLNVTGAKEVNELQRQAVEKSRLKIPILIGLDVIHGYRTIYPVPLGMSATWDPGLVERCARMAAVEATAEGVRWTFSPMVDIARDARWGRITEGSGEDPWLGSVMAAAWVRGYQGKDLADPASMVACAKHYVAYGAVEGGREYNLVDVSERVLRDVYLPPFKAACDAGAGTLMSAFNTLQGVPASANRHTLTDILRTEWGFRGFVVSDWGSIGELQEQGVALDGDEAARKAVTAGVDMDMQSGLYITKLAGLVKSGKLKMQVIDEAVRRILRIKFALGLFEHPYTNEMTPTTPAPDYAGTARQAAEESFVLLKNDPVNSKPVLPLADGQTVALIGPLADAKRHMLGAWSAKGEADEVVTLREALSQRLKEKLTYAKGVPIWDRDGSGIDEAIAAAKKCDMVVMALGEGAGMSGEATSRTSLDLPGRQLELLQAVVATGKPVALVLFSGRPLSIPWEAGHVPAILEAWFPGVQAGPALVRTLYGEVNPAGRLTASFPRSVGQMPLYYNTFNTGRPVEGAQPGDVFITGYRDERNTPLFPFGWGLSYTKFDYTPTLIPAQGVNAAELNKEGAIHVEATVTNSGALAGAEVAQLYIRERGTSVARPVRELKGFEKITLAPGESRRVQFVLTKKELSFCNIDLNQIVEPCELTVWIGPNSGGGRGATILIGE